MRIVKCGLSDCEPLAVMNKQLIEDERHDNPMNVSELKARMEHFITDGYEAVFWVDDSDNVIGYALINKAASPYYLRHFFICRNARRKGQGRVFFKELLHYLDTYAIDIEVLSWNMAGLAFWESVGFKPRSVYMRHEAVKRSQNPWRQLPDDDHKSE